MAIKTAVEIRIDVVLPNGKLGMTRQLLVTKPATVVVHPTQPVSPLPTQNAIQQQTSQLPVPTQPVAISPPTVQPVQPQFGTPIVHAPAPPQQQVQPRPVESQGGSPIILPNAPVEDDFESNPILQEHLGNEQPNVDEEPAESSSPPAANSPFALISKLING
jgi:hypothetical protein